MSLDYFLLDEDQSKPEIEVTEPLKFGYMIKNAFHLEDIVHYTSELHKLPWRIQEIEVAGKYYMPKRETLGFADRKHTNLLENRSFYGLTYPDIVTTIRNQVQDIIAENLKEIEIPKLNFCWGNRYRTGEDKVGKHKDREKWHSPVDPIVSVSFGEYRHFDIHDTTHRIERIDLGFGDIFLMMPGFQQAYYHAVPIQKRVHSSRINLTFRTLEHPPSLK